MQLLRLLSALPPLHVYKVVLGKFLLSRCPVEETQAKAVYSLTVVTFPDAFLCALWSISTEMSPKLGTVLKKRSPQH